MAREGAFGEGECDTRTHARKIQEEISVAMG